MRDGLRIQGDFEMRVDITIRHCFENCSREVRIFQGRTAEEAHVIALKITEFVDKNCETKLCEVATVFDRKAFLDFIRYLLEAAEKMK